MSPLLVSERKRFHKLLLDHVLTFDTKGIPSNADGSQKSSVAFATSIAHQLLAGKGERISGQASGNAFEKIVTEFLKATFLKLPHLRPGNWEVFQVGSRTKNKIADYSQYAHLNTLSELSKVNPSLAASLGNDYSISPDVVIARLPESDEEINKNALIVDASVSKMADLRLLYNEKSFLHASISTKWTVRSDRAQNARAEALNLLRNRKGRAPHIVLVTGEPTPSRLASIALGTGDIDCVYHFALPELKHAILESENDEAIHLLDIMTSGKRLKDISDLPLDLSV